MSSEDSGLFAQTLGAPSPQWAWSLPAPGGSWLGSHTNGVCTGRARPGKGEEEGWSRPASLSAAAHSQKSEAEDCTLRMASPR